MEEEKEGETSRLNSLLPWYLFKVVEEGRGREAKEEKAVSKSILFSPREVVTGLRTKTINGSLVVPKVRTDTVRTVCQRTTVFYYSKFL